MILEYFQALVPKTNGRNTNEAWKDAPEDGKMVLKKKKKKDIKDNKKIDQIYRK